MPLEPVGLPPEIFELKTSDKEAVNNKGEVEKPGAQRTRVSLLVRSELDKQKVVSINIRAKESLPEDERALNGIRHLRYVTVKSRDGNRTKSIDLSIKSLASHLNLDKNEIIKAAIENRIEQVIEDRLQQLRQNDKEAEDLAGIPPDKAAKRAENPSAVKQIRSPKPFASGNQSKVAAAWLRAFENDPEAFEGKSELPPKEILEAVAQGKLQIGDDEIDEEAIARQAESLLKDRSMEEMKRIAGRHDLAALSADSPEKRRFIELFNAKRKQSAGKEMRQPTRQQEQHALNTFQMLLREGKDKTALWGLFNLKFDPFLLPNESELKKALYQFVDDKIATSSTITSQTPPISAASRKVEKKTGEVESKVYWELPEKTPLQRMRQIAAGVDLFTVPKDVPVKDEFIKLFKSEQKGATKQRIEKGVLERKAGQEATAMHTAATLISRGDKRGAFFVILSQSFDPFLLPDSSPLKVTFYKLFDEIVSQKVYSSIITGNERHLKGFFSDNDRDVLNQKPLPHRSVKGAEFYGDRSVYSGETQGRGFLVYPDGSVFKGTFQIGLPYDGEVCYPKGVVFKGKMINGLPSQGAITEPGGHSIKGRFKEGKLDGWVKETRRGVRGYEKSFYQGGKQTGRKMKYNEAGQPISCERWPMRSKGYFYTGPVNGAKQPEGEGKVTKPDGTTYRATFRAGQETSAP